MFKFFKLDNFDFNSKVVGVRVDINSPIKNGKIMPNQRIIAAAQTISELSKKGARVVIIAHQGRNGKSDCISLQNHLELLEKEVKNKIGFIPEIYSSSVETKINSLKNGEILLLENLNKGGLLVFDDASLYTDYKPKSYSFNPGGNSQLSSTSTSV